MELLLAYGFENVAEDGHVIPVTFTGISSAPKKEIAYTKPAVIPTRAGSVVLSGLVAAENLSEIGRGEGSIRQANVPTLDSHDSPRRLNVELGAEPPNFEARALARALLGDTVLALSEIVEINGSAVPSHYNRARIEDMWQRPVRPRVDDPFLRW